ncbi:6-O-methylguanine DNA methyltransferase [Aspergillus granulosus]|uniref:Methylated-DNA--protein-cysteine methyltransferase n=1 Tax=Aspergillus granulosus TaxID=176169 RepID=A0ABR4H6F5_9EURO
MPEPAAAAPLSGPHESDPPPCGRSPGPGPLIDINKKGQDRLHRDPTTTDHDATVLVPPHAVAGGAAGVNKEQRSVAFGSHRDQTMEDSAAAAAAAAAENSIAPPPATFSNKEHSSNPAQTQVPEQHEQILKLTKKISTHPTLTPFRKRTYICLLAIPRGRWTTYAAMAKHLGSSARAVGTAMRLNPFAPGVPCHRVLNVDGGLGGYMGTPPEKDRGKKGPGKGNKSEGNLERKRRILESEGVVFDERGKARGRAFLEFPST